MSRRKPGQHALWVVPRKRKPKQGRGKGWLLPPIPCRAWGISGAAAVLQFTVPAHLVCWLHRRAAGRQPLVAVEAGAMEGEALQAVAPSVPAAGLGDQLRELVGEVWASKFVVKLGVACRATGVAAYAWGEVVLLVGGPPLRSLWRAQASLSSTFQWPGAGKRQQGTDREKQAQHKEGKHRRSTRRAVALLA